MFNFPASFPEGSMERYPCLTRALANNYPGPRYFFVNDASMMSTSTLSSSVAPDSYFGYSNATNPTGNEVDLRSSVCELNYIPILAQDHDVLKAEKTSTTLGACAAGASNYPALVPVVGRTKADHSKEAAKPAMKHDCALCGQSFRRLGALVTHLKRHQGPIGPIHKCDLCGQPFIRPSALKKHLKRHEEGFCKNPRPKHRCNICEKEFLRPSALETHLNMHYNRQRALHDPSFAPWF
ncbi:hypothetical protein DFH06DRAFT_1320504 [Mycena polygramma]|nr:hypothetical protein DFH06DRAFT_1320504 [Mycena polygramma]